jgi:hypothetical protein
MCANTSLLYPKTPPSSTPPTRHLDHRPAGNTTSHTTRYHTNGTIKNTTQCTSENITNNITENITSCTALTTSAFFTPVPTDQILALAGARRLKRPDAMLLLALLSHKRRPHVTEVRPRQDRIVKRYLRDRLGRVHGLRYDLAQTLALLPAKATRASHGAAPRPGGVQAPSASQSGPNPAPAPKRQKCRPESESDDAEIDNSADGPATPPVPPVVQDLIGVGVIGRIAEQLCARYGEARCRQALAVAARRKGITNAPAWIYRCLTEGWDLARAVPSRPQSQHEYTPLAPSTPPDAAHADVLTDLAPDAFDALERAARARLIAETPVLRPVFEKGRRTPALRARMRGLLAAGVGV